MSGQLQLDTYLAQFKKSAADKCFIITRIIQLAFYWSFIITFPVVIRSTMNLIAGFVWLF